MKAVRLREIGGPRNLVVEEIAQPSPGPGEISVRVKCAALNRRDVYISQGLYPGIELPRTLGADASGEVAALGAGVDGPTLGTPVIIDPLIGWGDDPQLWSPGATILGMPRDGTFAQYVVAPAANVYGKPSRLSFAQAAALPLAGVTAYRATFTRGRLKAGETVLITGIGGGVQTFVLLYAKQIGARAVVTSSSDAKLARALELGAEVAVNYAASEQWHKEVKAAAGAPIDLVIDSAGGDAFAKALSIVRPGGRVVSYGGTSGDATIKLFPLFWNQLTICGSSMGSPWDFQAMLELVRAGITPVVDRVFPIDQVVEAAEHLDRAEQFGKVVLEITP